MTFWARLLVVQLAILQLVVQLAWDGVRSVRKCAWSALRWVLCPSSRVARVTSALHNLCPDHSSLIPAHNSHARVPHARCVVTSVGDTEDGGRLSCVYGGTKSMSTSTRTGVRRYAVYGSAHTRQTPLKLHVETWEGISRNQGIFREMDILPGCAVRVACPSCPDYYPVSPGPGRIIRNMLGWTQLEKKGGSGVWLFRGALQGENLFVSPCRSRRLGKEGVVSHSVGGPL